VDNPAPTWAGYSPDAKERFVVPHHDLYVTDAERIVELEKSHVWPENSAVNLFNHLR